MRKREQRKRKVIYCEGDKFNGDDELSNIINSNTKSGWRLEFLTTAISWEGSMYHTLVFCEVDKT